MKKLTTILLLLPLATIACSQAGTGDLRISLQPAAFSGGEFSTGPTDVTVEGCDLAAAGIETVEVTISGSFLTEAAEPATFTASQIQGSCELDILVPEGEDIEVVIETFDVAGDLSRKSIGVITQVVEGIEIELQMPLWPARRIADAQGDGGGGDLAHIDIVRQLDQFFVEMVFTDIVFPATQGGARSVNGFIELVENPGDETYYILLDASVDGMTVYAESDGTAVGTAGFKFVVGGIRISVPYDQLGGATDEGGIVVSPDLDLSITLLDANDEVLDQLPEDGEAPISIKE